MIISQGQNADWEMAEKDMEKKVNKKGVFIVLVLGAVITSLMTTVMSTALPAIMNTFSLPASTAQMVTSIYSLVSGIVIIATAIIIKKVPTRRLFFISMIIFTVGILLSALSPNFAVLLLGRIVQGVGYGVLISLTQVVILVIVSPSRRGFAMGIYGLAVVFAPILGPILAGLIIDHTTWRLIFWIVLFMCIADLILGFLYMRNVLETSPQTLDIPSMILAAIGFTGLVLAAGNIGSYAFFSVQIGLLLAIGILALILFALRQFKLEKPLLNLRVCSNRDFTVAVIVSMLLMALMNASSTILPIFIQTVMGQSATMFGIAIAPCAICLASLSPLTGKIYDKRGLRMLAIIGCAIVLISNVGFLLIDETAPIPVLMILMALLGIGLSGIQMNIVTYGMAGISVNAKTDGNAILSCLRTIGSALGTAIFVAIMSIGVNDSQYTTADVHRSYLFMALVAAVALVLSVVFIRKKDVYVSE